MQESSIGEVIEIYLIVCGIVYHEAKKKWRKLRDKVGNQI